MSSIVVHTLTGSFTGGCVGGLAGLFLGGPLVMVGSIANGITDAVDMCKGKISSPPNRAGQMDNAIVDITFKSAVCGAAIGGGTSFIISTTIYSISSLVSYCFNY